MADKSIHAAPRKQNQSISQNLLLKRRRPLSIKLTGPILFLIIVFSCNFVFSQSTDDQWPVLTGLYLGQETPGETAKLFAPGIISGRGHTHGSVAVSPDLKTIYWDERINENLFHKIYFSRYVDNRWTMPQAVPFTEKLNGETPVLSPDGKKLYFNSIRPTKEKPESRKENIWYVDVLGDSSWSAPILFSDAINSGLLHWQISVDRRGNIYFGSERTPNLGQDDIFYSAFKEGAYQPPENLGRPVNSALHEGVPFINPDLRYLLFGRLVNRVTCIFISYPGENGTWEEPINLTLKHPTFNGTCPRVSPDGKFIFFNRYENRQANVYWISATILSGNSN